MEVSSSISSQLLVRTSFPGFVVILLKCRVNKMFLSAKKRSAPSTRMNTIVYCLDWSSELVRGVVEGQSYGPDIDRQGIGRQMR